MKLVPPTYSRYLFEEYLVQSGKASKQSEEIFTAVVRGKPRRFSMHDYRGMYWIPKLYDAMIYGLLHCETPRSSVFAHA